MAVADLITLGIGPSSDITTFTTFGLNIGAAALTPDQRTIAVPARTSITVPSRGGAIKVTD